MTLTKTHRNMNVMVKDGGKHFSLSQVSTYKLTDREFSETLLFQIQRDRGQGNHLRHERQNAALAGPNRGPSDRVQYPFEAPTMTFDGDKATARARRTVLSRSGRKSNSA